MKIKLFYTQNNRNTTAGVRSSRYLLLVILLTVSTFTGFTQIEVKWTKELPADILWQEVTALGNLIVSSNNQLVGIDIETGEIRWSKPEHAGLNREAFGELPSTLEADADADERYLRAGDQKLLLSSMSRSAIDTSRGRGAAGRSTVRRWIA